VPLALKSGIEKPIEDGVFFESLIPFTLEFQTIVSELTFAMRNAAAAH